MIYLQLVYDKDTFSTDDFMGSAEIDIQPLVSAATASESSSTSEPVQLGNQKASKEENRKACKEENPKASKEENQKACKEEASKEENTVARDGAIILEDGKVKQQIAVRLQNVESGILEIEIECMPLIQ